MTKSKRISARVAGIVMSAALTLTILPTDVMLETVQAAAQAAQAAAESREAKDPVFTGEGTAESPFQIKSKKDLKKFRDLVNNSEKYKVGSDEKPYSQAHYILTSDIDLSDNSADEADGDYELPIIPETGDASKNWTPIGRSSQGIDQKIGFEGVFDGGGHTIKGMYENISSYGRYYTSGLFGNNLGTIKNLNVTEVNFEQSGWYVGIIAGTNRGTIENCYVSGTVNGFYVIGGIAGSVSGDSAVIKNCYSDAKVTSKIAGTCAPITSALTEGAKVENSYFPKDKATSVDIKGAEAATDEDLKSGKIAWLLQNGQSEKNKTVWVQKIGTENSPVLADKRDSDRVYKAEYKLGKEEVYAQYRNSGGKITAPDIEIDVEGYTIGTKWYKDEDLKTEWNFESDTITQDTILYSDAKAIEYDITYNLNGGEAAGNPDKYTIESEDITLNRPTKKGGYEFEGWSGTGITDKELDVTIKQGSTGNREYFAEFRDTALPDVTIKVGESHSWDFFHEHNTFDLFFNQSQEVSITATDNEDKDPEILYYLSDKFLTMDQLGKLSKSSWKKYTEPFKIDPERKVVIYAAGVEDDGDRGVVNSTGIVLDITSPQINGIADGKTYCRNASFTVTEEYLDKVTIDNEEVQPDESGKYLFSKLGAHTVVVTDKAGNSSSASIKIQEHKPGYQTKQTIQYPDCDDTGTRVINTYCATCKTLYSTEEEILPAKGHVFNEWKDVVSPDCDDEGQQRRVCIVCGYSETKGVSAKGHDWEDELKVDKEPTCYEEGSRSRHCKNCDITKDSETIPMTEHTPGKPTKDKENPATCVDGGSYEQVVSCDVCHAEISRTLIAIPATGHSYGDWEEVTSPDCDDEGVKQRKCSNCGDVDSENVVAEGHTWEETPRIDKEATCVADGSKSTHCAKCNATINPEVIPATGHTPGDKVKENEILPSCTTPGSYDEVVYCKVCEGEVSRTTVRVDPIPHDFGEWETIDTAECDNDGYEQRSCKTCGYTETNGLSATGHSWNEDFVTDTEATCETDGSRSIRCTKCGAVKESQSIPATGHKPGKKQQENVVPPDCTIHGSYEEVTYCTVCDKEVSRELKSTDPLGHQFTEWETKESPTCDDDGVQERYCEVCKFTETRNVDETGHDWESEPTIDKEPTCGTEGSKSIHCKNCDAVKGSEIIPILGHTAGEAEIEKEVKADCENEGSYEEVIKCTVCGEEISRVKRTRPKLGHTPGETVIENEVEADCEKAGSYDEVVYCEVCDKEVSRNTIEVEAHGHTPGKLVVENATQSVCEKGGTYDEVIYCEVCEKEISRETIETEPLGHTPDEAVIENEVDAKCEKAGSYDQVVYCKVCHKEISRKTVEVPALEHVPGKTVFEKEVVANCEEGGSYDEVVYCEVCEKELSRKTVEIAAHGHKPGEKVIENEVSANCEVGGTHDEVVYCDVCGDELSRETVKSDAHGHTPTGVVIENEVLADCEKGGSYDEVVYCKVCGKEIGRHTVNIDAHGHKYAEKVLENVVEADCDSEGSYDEVIYCKACGKELSRETITSEPLGHKFGEWETIESSKCDNHGSQKRVCTVCGYTETEGLDPTGHDWEDTATVDKEPTCIEEGSKSVHCKNCDAVKDSETIPQLGHDTELTGVKEATCTENGYTGDTVCKRCEEVVTKGKTIPAKGHSYFELVCTVCGDTITLSDSQDIDDYIADLNKQLENEELSELEAAELNNKLSSYTQAKESLDEVKGVKDMIENLPDPDEVTTEDEELIESVLKAYDTLSRYEQELIKDSEIRLRLVYEALVSLNDVPPVEDSSSEEDSSAPDSSSQDDSSAPDSSSEADSSSEDDSSLIGAGDDTNSQQGGTNDSSADTSDTDIGDNSIADSSAADSDTGSDDSSSDNDSNTNGDSTADDSSAADTSSKTDSANDSSSKDDKSSSSKTDSSSSSSSKADSSSAAKTATTTTTTTTKPATTNTTAAQSASGDSSPDTGSAATGFATVLILAGAMVIVANKNKK